MQMFTVLIYFINLRLFLLFLHDIFLNCFFLKILSKILIFDLIFVIPFHGLKLILNGKYKNI